MFGPHEAWLSIGAMAFYLADSMVLLYADQLLVERAGGRWWPRRGSSMLLAGQRPYLPNPLMPHRPLLLVSFEQLLGTDQREDSDLQPLFAALGPLPVLALSLLVLFGLLPALLYVAGTGMALLGWLACVYAVVVLMVGVIWHRRDRLGLSRGAAMKLGFELVACSPMAINVVRRITLRAETPSLHGSKQLFGVDGAERLSGVLRLMLDEREIELSPGEPAMLQIEHYRKHLAGDMR